MRNLSAQGADVFIVAIAQHHRLPENVGVEQQTACLGFAGRNAAAQQQVPGAFESGVIHGFHHRCRQFVAARIGPLSLAAGEFARRAGA